MLEEMGKPKPNSHRAKIQIQKASDSGKQTSLRPKTVIENVTVRSVSHVKQDTYSLPRTVSKYHPPDFNGYIFQNLLAANTKVLGRLLHQPDELLSSHSGHCLQHSTEIIVSALDLLRGRGRSVRVRPLHASRILIREKKCRKNWQVPALGNSSGCIL